MRSLANLCDIVGVAGGLAIATFSKTLAVLIGFAICSIQVSWTVCPDDDAQSNYSVVGIERLYHARDFPHSKIYWT